MQQTVTYKTVYYLNMYKTDPAQVTRVTVRRRLICVTCNSTCVIITTLSTPTYCLLSVNLYTISALHS